MLEEKGKNTDAVWKDIIANDGSVDHVDFLSKEEKAVFRTAFELKQTWVVEHAAKRQEFICQGQSVNLFFPSGANKKYVRLVHELAFKEGLKGLYYLRTSAGASADKVGKLVERLALKDFEGEEEDVCVSCQG